MSQMSRNVREMILTDIQRIDNLLLNGTDDERFDLHREMDAKYQVLIQNWYVGLQKMSKDPDLMRVKYNRLRENPERTHHNLFMMKYKLEAALLGININVHNEVNLNIDSSVHLQINFDKVYQEITQMPSLSEIQKKETIEKIDEIKNIVQSPDERNAKWNKIKPILIWLADKSADIGIALLPLLLGL